jgi:hypothetical protein
MTPEVVATDAVAEELRGSVTEIVLTGERQIPVHNGLQAQFEGS